MIRAGDTVDGTMADVQVKEVYEKVKEYIRENGEKDFSFLSKIEEINYNKMHFKEYKEIVENKNKTEGTTKNRIVLISYKMMEKIKGFIRSINENGLIYTYNRILFHLGLKSDNDPYRTKMTGRKYIKKRN